MSVNFDDFNVTTPQNSDYVVGYSTATSGGERRWTVAALRNTIINGAASTISTSDLPINSVVVSNGSGKIAIASNISTTELGFLEGLTGNIQAQLNSKQSGTLTSITGDPDYINITGTGNTRNITIDTVTTSKPGIMSAEDKVKLNSLSLTPVFGVVSPLNIATVVTPGDPPNITFSIAAATRSTPGSMSAADKVKLDDIAPVTTSANGLMVAADKVKLNNLTQGITAINASGAISFSVTSGKTNERTITIANATTTTAGLMAPEDKAKLDNFPSAPVGAVMAFAMNTSPPGWVFCNGEAVSRTGIYKDLFDTIGTTYGSGNTTTTFNLPDLRGYFIRGTGINSDLTASGPFGQKQADEFKSHSHVLYGNDLGTAPTQLTAPALYQDDAERAATDLDTIQPTGGSETRPKNIAMRYCIKY